MSPAQRSLINDMTPRSAWTFAMPLLTGTIHFLSNSVQVRYHEYSKSSCMRTDCPNASGFTTAWARFSLPRWLSCRVLEVVAHRSRIGWKQYIRVRNIFPRLDHDASIPYHGACEDIAYGQFQSLKAKVDRREVTPWDEDGRGETMWAVSSTRSTSLCSCL